MAFGADIPGARSLTLDGVGHELPMVTWDAIVTALLDHTGRSQDDEMSHAGQMGSS